jgi:hypothetical protein
VGSGHKAQGKTKDVDPAIESQDDSFIKGRRMRDKKEAHGAGKDKRLDSAVIQPSQPRLLWLDDRRIQDVSCFQTFVFS